MFLKIGMNIKFVLFQQDLIIRVLYQVIEIAELVVIELERGQRKLQTQNLGLNLNLGLRLNLSLSLN